MTRTALALAVAIAIGPVAAGQIAYPLINELNLANGPPPYAEILNPDPFNPMDVSGYTVLMHWDTSVPPTQSVVLPGAPGSLTTVLPPLGMLIVRDASAATMPATMPVGTPVFSTTGTLGWIIANTSPPGGAVGILDGALNPVDEMTFLNPSGWASLGIWSGTIPGVAGIQTIRRCQYYVDFNSPADFGTGVTDVTPGVLNTGQGVPTLVVNSNLTFGSALDITIGGCVPGAPFLLAYSIGGPTGTNIGANNLLDLSLAPGGIVPIIDGFGIYRFPPDLFGACGACGNFVLGGAVPGGLAGQTWTLQAAALNALRPPYGLDLTTSATVFWQ